MFWDKYRDEPQRLFIQQEHSQSQCTRTRILWAPRVQFGTIHPRASRCTSGKSLAIVFTGPNRCSSRGGLSTRRMRRHDSVCGLFIKCPQDDEETHSEETKRGCYKHMSDRVSFPLPVGHFEVCSVTALKRNTDIETELCRTFNIINVQFLKNS